MPNLEKEKLLWSIGNCIRMERIKKDKTAKEIASILRITTQGYSKIERGRCDISLSRLVELAKLYDVSLIDLVPEDEVNLHLQC